MSSLGGVFPAYCNIAGAAEPESPRSSRCSSLIIRPHNQSASVVWRQLPRSWPAWKASSSVMSLAPGEPKELSLEPRLAGQLRCGGLAEDGLSYIEKFKVRSYEVGINKTATIQTIANYMQEIFCNHAISLGHPTDGFSSLHNMKEKHLIWVTSGMHFEIFKYPAWDDVVEIETWCQSEGRINIRRESILKDCATGQVIGKTTSKWLIMNQDTRRLQKVTDDVLEEVLKHSPKSIRLAFPEKSNASRKKIDKLDYDSARYSKLGLVPPRGDLDMNQHVNNVTYIGWVLESMPPEIIYSHEIQSLTVEYKRECCYNDVVDSLTSPESITTDILAVSEHPRARDEKGFLQFRHLLRLSRDDGCEVCRARTLWRKKMN